MKRWLLGFALLFSGLTIQATVYPNPVGVFKEKTGGNYTVYFSGVSSGDLPGPFPYVEIQVKVWDDYSETYVDYDTLGTWPSEFALWSCILHGVPAGYYIALFGEDDGTQWIFSEAIEFSVGMNGNPPIEK